MPTKQIGTGEFGESVEIHPSDTGDIVVELDGHTVARRFGAMADARAYCRQAFGVTAWATYPALLLLALLAGACSVDSVPFGGAELGGAGVLSRGAGGEAAGGSVGAAGGPAGAAGGVVGSGGVLSSGGTVASTGGAPGTGGTVLPGSGGGAGGAGGAATGIDDCYAKKTWNAQDDQYMRPGSSCNSCHQFTMAGTVFVRPTEPDNCYGVDGTKNSVSVLIVGAGNLVLALKVNESGNFWTTSHIAFPAMVSVNYGSASVRMQETVSKSGGDCNSCHTANTPPGRILAP